MIEQRLQEKILSELVVYELLLSRSEIEYLFLHLQHRKTKTPKTIAYKAQELLLEVYRTERLAREAGH